MRNDIQPVLQRTGVHIERVLAFVLLAGIVYSVTFGAAHNHADASAQLNADNNAGIVLNADLDAVASHHGTADDQDCLICRFHQQLFNSVVHNRVFVTEPLARIASASVRNTDQYISSFASTPIARRSGRAPPQA